MKSVQIWSFSGPYFPAFGLNTGKYGPEKTPYLDTFHAVFGKAKLTLVTITAEIKVVTQNLKKFIKSLIYGI